MEDPNFDYIRLCNTTWVHIVITEITIRFNVEREEFYRRFRSFFGINPVEVQYVWDSIKSTALAQTPKHEKKHLLLL